MPDAQYDFNTDSKRNYAEMIWYEWYQPKGSTALEQLYIGEKCSEGSSERLLAT